MRNGRNYYDKEFKMMAVELFNSGKSSTEIGKDLGISHDTARKWRN
jgi:transposase-like protein